MCVQLKLSDGLIERLSHRGVDVKKVRGGVEKAKGVGRGKGDCLL